MKILRSCQNTLALILLPRIAAAQALGNADEINVGGGGGGDLKGTILSIAQKILDFVSLVAVVVIIIAGIWLIVGLGEESSKDRAKKIVIYTIAGLILILIARAIVTFVINTVV
ncbi:hypothetical protein AUJ46_05300 [Candidatus Peregrinibacteria bacterium CG1_02_54_53]|nr:MAG: hypothetical protein AUJ46_05300 [Candidatus Peregrinibacteria bacterium CG1_02_54_53]